jgi:CDP-diacylglycerol--glycerol-3-phosphate 3-phosphatidyltransferase
MNEKILNLPNTLTLARIALIPLIVVLLHFPEPLACLWAAVLFLLAALTDLVDGWYARSRGLVTNLGKFLDPLADKLLVLSVLVMLVDLGWVPGWIVIVILARETAVTGMRAIASDMGTVVAADRYGKLKTILQIAALVPLMVHYPLLGLDPRPLGLILLYGARALTVISGVKYLYNFYKTCLTRV